MRRNRRFVFVCLVALLADAPTVLAATQALPDSQSIVKAVRKAQSQFEQQRARYLPWTHTMRGGESETIGRFRFWYDEDPTRRAVSEHERVVEMRSTLVALLDSVSAVVPGDDWILGQHVRYLTEAGLHERALRRLTPCRGTRWWCLALTGFVWHDRGEYVAADDQFARALRHMPDSTRCRWTDLSQILDGNTLRAYRSLTCAERHDFESRVWWLADPLLLVPGNERRTEHYARRAYNQMLSRSTSTFGLRWGNDNAEMVMRFGWAVHWKRATPDRPSFGSGPTIIGEQRQGGFHFMPSRTDLDGADSPTTPRKWPLKPARPRARYAAAYANEFVPLDHQLSVWKRRDSVVVLAVYRSPTIADDDGRAKRYTGRAVLALAPSDTVKPNVTRGRAGRPLAMRVPTGQYLMALETLSTRDSVAGRERYWIDVGNRIPPGFSVSDLLLIEPAPKLPRSLAEAIPLARLASDVQTEQTIGVFWEFYDPPPGAGHIQVRLSVERTDKGFVRKAGEFLGVIGKRGDGMQMRWRDQYHEAASHGRSISVRLPEVPGRYRLTLRAADGDGTIAQSARELVVRRGRR